MIKECKTIAAMLMLLLCISIASIAQDKPMTLRDSLLQKFTPKELQEMTSEQRYIEIMLMRGNYEKAKKEIDRVKRLDSINEYNRNFDRWGVRLVHDIPVERESQRIDSLVKYINANKHNMRQEVFPNAYRDQIEDFRQFYRSFVTRELSGEFDVMVKEAEWGPKDIESMKMIYGFHAKQCNYTRRTYYFDESNKLQLVEIITKPDINKEARPHSERKVIYIGETIYKYYRYYVQNDSLIYLDFLRVGQGLKKPAYMYHEYEEIMEEPVDIHGGKLYFYKNNSFNRHYLSGNPLRGNWKEWLEEQEYEPSDSHIPFNGAVFEFRNTILEYEEYINGENKYLHPIYCSDLEPFIIEP